MSDERLSKIIEQIERLAGGDVSYRGQPSDADDDLDAVIVGLNLLADDYSAHQQHTERARAVMGDVIDLFERAPVMLFSIDIDSGAILKANETTIARLGRGSDGVVGVPLRDHVEHDSLETFDTVLTDLRSGVAALDHEIQITNRDGRSHSCLLSATLVQNSTARTRRARCTLVDIEHRRGLEEQLAQAQKMEAIGQLAGGVAHDFNNLITIIQNHVDLALELIPAHSESATDLEEVLKATAQAGALTSQLLAFSRKQVVVPRVFRINDVVERTHRMLSRLLGEHIEVSVALARDLWATRIDPGQLEQIVLNLAVNARDAIGSHGKLTLETANVTLDAEYARSHAGVEPGAYVMLAVSDDGTGMTKEIAARVFEPFFTTKPMGVGTGLGLATCYGIAKQAGGHIWVYSEPGQGTTFKVYLPRANRKPEGLPVDADKGKAPAGGDETIIVLEDDEQLRAVVVRILAGSGYRVLPAGDGEQALEQFDAVDGAVDFLLTDVVVPKLSGREVAERMSKRSPNLQVMFVSGYTDNAIVQHGVLEPGINFLQKPFRPAELLARVRGLLDG